MKWLKLFVVSVVIGAIIPIVTPSSPALASTTADVTVTFTPNSGSGIPSIPISLTLTDLGAVTVTGNWTMGSVNATHIMIRASREDYPSTITDGELMYFGSNTSTNWTGFCLEINEYHFSAWSYNSGSGLFSTSYITESIGGDGLESVSESLDGLTLSFQGFTVTIEDILLCILLIGITLIAFRERENMLLDIVLYVISGMIAFAIGALWFDDYRLIAIAIVGLGLFQLVLATTTALQSGGPSKGFSQFKGVYNAIRGAFRR